MKVFKFDLGEYQSMSKITITIISPEPANSDD